MSRVSGAGVIRHTHKYVREVRGSRPQWRCALDGCSHFIPHNTSVIGRKSICWECSKPFTMTDVQDEDMSDDGALPKCMECRGMTEAELAERSAKARKVQELLGRAPQVATVEQRPHDEDCSTLNPNFPNAECDCSRLFDKEN